TRQERALVQILLSEDARGDVLAALPHRRCIKRPAVATCVQIGAAFHARRFRRAVAEDVLQPAALIAFECFGTEAAGSASARRAFEPLLTEQLARRSARRRLRRLLR